MKVECDDWYGRNLDAEQREHGFKWTNAEERLTLVEELQKQSKELAELIQEQRNPVPKNIRGKY